MLERNKSNSCIINKCILILLSVFAFAVLFANTEVKAQTWQRMKMILPDGYSLLSNSGVVFATKHEGWLQTTGRDPSSNIQVSWLFRTTDGGDSWSYQSNTTGSVFVLDSNNIWMRSGNYILVTKNGGQSFDTLECQITFDMWCFHDQQHGIAIATWLDKQWFTDDGGKSWNIGDTTMYFGSITDIDFPSPMHVWVVGEGSLFGADIGMIAHTSDGGPQWEYQKVYPPSYQVPVLYGVDFVDSSFGFAVGVGRLLRTTDGGKTWQNNIFFSPGNDITFLTEKLLFITGGAGIIHLSRDGGDNWHTSWTGTDATFISLHSLKNDGYIVAFGKNSSREFILVRSDVSTLTHVEEQARYHPELSILDHFPNPFSENVTISISSIADSRVSITVRSLLGLQVAYDEIVIGHDGVHRWSWNPKVYTGISNGLYICTIQSGNDQKCVLLHYFKQR